MGSEGRSQILPPPARCRPHERGRKRESLNRVSLGDLTGGHSALLWVQQWLITSWSGEAVATVSARFWS